MSDFYGKSATSWYRPGSVINSGSYLNPTYGYDGGTSAAVDSSTNAVYYDGGSVTYYNFGTGSKSGTLHVNAWLTGGSVDGGWAQCIVEYTTGGFWTTILSGSASADGDSFNTGLQDVTVALTSINLANLQVKVTTSSDTWGGTNSYAYVYDVVFVG